LLLILVVYLLNLFLDEEKALVEEVFNNAIDILSEDDKKLPQVSKTIDCKI